MENKRIDGDENTGSDTSEKINPPSSPGIHEKAEARKEPSSGHTVCQTEIAVPATGSISDKRGGGGFLLFFSFLVSLTSIFFVLYLFTDSARIKSRLETAELESDFFNKRSEMLANDISQWQNNIKEEISGLDKRLNETESLLKNDLKERRDIELTKLLMGINELSRLSDDSDRSRIEQAAAILQSITISDTKNSLLNDNPVTEEKARTVEESPASELPDVIEENNDAAPDDAPGESAAEEEKTGENAPEEGINDPGAIENEATGPNTGI